MTIALRAVAPTQSWGSVSRFKTRDTELVPTKSGVVGLIASALGMDRSDDISDLAGLEMAVRIDAPGRLIGDFQTFDHGDGAAQISTRYYLDGAAFLIVLRGSDELEERIEAALRRPKRMLFFGRRACVPGAPIFSMRTDASIDDVLASHPHLGDEPPVASSYDVVRDLRDGDDPLVEFTSVMHDVPLSFDPRARRFASRIVTWTHVEANTPEPEPEPESDAPAPVGVVHVDL